MIRTRTRRGRKQASSIQRWHPRRLQQHGDSVFVCIPAQLIRWARSRSHDAGLWNVGDWVQVGMTPEGKLVIEFVGRITRGTGPVIDESVDGLKLEGSKIVSKSKSKSKSSWRGKK